jgi:hypothetical protein
MWPSRFITGRGIDAAKKVFADIRTWPGGLRQFLTENHRDPETMRLAVEDKPTVSPELKPAHQTLTIRTG